MKILVLSDSHGVYRYMEEAVLREQPDQILHLGDRERDAEHLEEVFQEIPLVSVPGNCDFPMPQQPLSRLLEFDGVRVLMTHGHPYGVKSGLLSMELAAREAEADVAVFGHTHRAYCEQLDGLWLMNPGACSGGRPSYGVISIENGQPLCYTLKAD